ncbi:MAG TPA: GDYXXLXY domain-containing protein [Erythrobacter sp.]|nr:GDYXXLXY domain-containing protein [Erythrobacter sp.]
MNRLVRLAAVIAPLLGLAALWATSHQTYQQGTEWEVPVAGYDPRDYLRGHYVEFSYDWPGIEEFRDAPPQMLCLEGAAPALTRVTADSKGVCAHPIRADATGVYGWEGLTRGRLYLGQDRAMALQGELQERGQRGIVTIRQREDGSFTPIRIRFRPLTAAEQADRDAQNADPFAPPVIDLPESSGNPPPSPQSAP